MAVRLRFDVKGINEFDARLDRFNLDNRNLNPLWDSIARSFVYYTSRQFSSSGAEFGEPWVPVQSARYAALKAERWPGKPTLEASGALRRSLTSLPLAVDRRTRHSLTLGTNLPYASIHQRGVPKGTKMHFKIGDQWVTINGLPRRKILGTTAGMRTSWRKKIQRFLVRNETSAGEER